MTDTEFIRFYEAHRVLLERCVLSHALRNEELAKDALQHGLAAAVTKFRAQNFDANVQGEFLKYTLTCSENFIRHEWKKQGREPNYDAESFQEPSIEDHPEMPMMIDQLEKSLHRLPENERRAIQAWYFEQPPLSQFEAAALMGTSVSSFKRLRDKAMEHLRMLMGVEEIAV